MKCEAEKGCDVLIAHPYNNKNNRKISQRSQCKLDTGLLHLSSAVRPDIFSLKPPFWNTNEASLRLKTDRTTR